MLTVILTVFAVMMGFGGVGVVIITVLACLSWLESKDE